jgi:FtsP/CotA-like multicopper oxidase with cupredoxin domain
MKHTLAHAAATALAFAALAVPAQLATAAPSAPEVPATLVPPAGNKLYLSTHAEGVQIYRCNAVTASWTLDGPRADLYAANGKQLGTHYAGPSWEARDGSVVTATRVDGVNMDPTAVDWLLLAKKTTTVGADGDRLAATTFIQRVDTTGGRAPASTECDVTGEIAEVAYTATYHFWKAAG